MELQFHQDSPAHQGSYILRRGGYPMLQPRFQTTSSSSSSVLSSCCTSYKNKGLYMHINGLYLKPIRFLQISVVRLFRTHARCIWDSHSVYALVSGYIRLINMYMQRCMPFISVIVCTCFCDMCCLYIGSYCDYLSFKNLVCDCIKQVIGALHVSVTTHV